MVGVCGMCFCVNYDVVGNVVMCVEVFDGIVGVVGGW